MYPESDDTLTYHISLLWIHFGCKTDLFYHFECCKFLSTFFGDVAFCYLMGLRCTSFISRSKCTFTLHMLIEDQRS